MFRTVKYQDPPLLRALDAAQEMGMKKVVEDCVKLKLRADAGDLRAAPDAPAPVS